MNGSGAMAVRIDDAMALVKPFKDAAIEVVDLKETRFPETFSDFLAPVTYRAVNHDRLIFRKTSDRIGIEVAETDPDGARKVGDLEFLFGPGVEEEVSTGFCGEFGNGDLLDGSLDKLVDGLCEGGVHSRGFEGCKGADQSHEKGGEGGHQGHLNIIATMAGYCNPEGSGDGA